MARLSAFLSMFLYYLLEFRSWRREVELLRTTRPCNSRLLEVRTDIEEFGDIQGDPHYVPDCDEEGILWKV